MRRVLIAMVVAMGLLGVFGAPAAVTDGVAATTVYAQEIDIQIGEQPWYEQPVWIAISVIGVLVLVILVVLAVRGGGTRV